MRKDGGGGGVLSETRAYSSPTREQEGALHFAQARARTAQELGRVLAAALVAGAGQSSNRCTGTAAEGWQQEMGRSKHGGVFCHRYLAWA